MLERELAQTQISENTTHGKSNTTDRATVTAPPSCIGEVDTLPPPLVSADSRKSSFNSTSSNEGRISGRRPVLERFYSLPETPSVSPARHHFRLPNAAPRTIKETLNVVHSANQHGQIINNYQFLRQVGKGSFGAVYQGVDLTSGIQYAIKEFSKSHLVKLNRRYLLDMKRKGQLWSGKAADLIRKEVAIMKKLDHPNLLTLAEVLDDANSDKLYMILEWCENGYIMQPERIYDGKAPKLDEEQARLYFRDMILGIEYLHENGIVHRDIKADNVLLGSDDVLKIADFGVSEMFDTPDNDIVRKCVGSPAYMAPELARLAGGGDVLIGGNDFTKVSGRKTDIWAMGVTLFYMVHGHLPFEAESLSSLYHKVIHEEVIFDESLSQELRDLLGKLLRKVAVERISMDGLREHPWVTLNGQDKLLSREENLFSISDEPITGEELRSAIENVQMQYGSTIDANDATSILLSEYGWRGLVSQSENDISSEENRRVASESIPQRPIIARGASGSMVKINNLTRALDEFMRKRQWESQR